MKIDLVSSVIGHLQTLNRFLRSAGPDEVEWWLATMVSHTAQIAGEIAFDVQDISKAENYYTLAIEAADLAGDQALQSIVLQEEIEQACHVASEALSLARQTKSSRAGQRLCKLQRELKSWRTTVDVQQFKEQLMQLKAG